MPKKILEEKVRKCSSFLDQQQLKQFLFQKKNEMNGIEKGTIEIWQRKRKKMRNNFLVPKLKLGKFRRSKSKISLHDNFTF